jgi:uncharacterized protein DUF6481
MSGFKEPDFLERQEIAAEAKKVALEKFRARAVDPALAERLTARIASAASRRAAKDVRETEKAEKKARDAERAQQAEREAAVQAERAAAESANRELALQAERKAARGARYAARKSRFETLTNNETSPRRYMGKREAQILLWPADALRGRSHSPAKLAVAILAPLMQQRV